jgi:hypothetical protein
MNLIAIPPNVATLLPFIADSGPENSAIDNSHSAFLSIVSNEYRPVNAGVKEKPPNPDMGFKHQGTRVQRE